MPTWVEDDTVLLYVAVEAEANTTEGDNWSLCKEYFVGHAGTCEAHEDLRAGSFSFFPPQSRYPGKSVWFATPGNQAASKLLFPGARPSVTVSPAWRRPVGGSPRMPLEILSANALNPDLVEETLSEGTVPLTQEQYGFCVAMMRSVRAVDAGLPEALAEGAGNSELLIHKAWPVECSMLRYHETGEPSVSRLGKGRSGEDRNLDRILLGVDNDALLTWNGPQPRAEEGQRLLLTVLFDDIETSCDNMTLDLYSVGEPVASSIPKSALTNVLSYSKEQMKDMADSNLILRSRQMPCFLDVTDAMAQAEAESHGFVLRVHFFVSQGVFRWVSVHTDPQGKGGLFVVAATDAPATVPGATP